MTERNFNEKSSNKENKKNDMGRPKDEKGNEKTPPRYKNFAGKPIE